MNWSNKNVLVTGACGFIGSHLVEHLLEMDASVRAFVYYNSFGSWGWLDTLPDDAKERIDVFLGDVRDGHHVRSSMRDIDVVFHLAALIAIPYSYNAPSSYVRTNVEGTVNVLLAAKDEEVGRIIHTSTSEVYGTARYVPIDESHPLQPQSPYSASKIGADCIAESFYRSYNLPVVIARPFNTFGPRQSARAVIPTIISQILAGQSAVRLGSRHPTRDFTFVKDTVAGLVRLAEVEDAVGSVVNIGSNFEISIGQLAEKIKKIMTSDIEIEFDDERVRPARSEVERLWANNDRIFKLTGWRPQHSLDEGLEQTIVWMQSNLQRYKPAVYNI